MSLLMQRSRHFRHAPSGAQLDHAHPLLRELVAWWDFREGGGDVLRDSGPAHLHANRRDCQRAVGAAGRAIQTSGANTEFASVDAYASLLDVERTDPLSVLFVVNTASRVFVAHGRATTTAYWQAGISAGAINFNMRGVATGSDLRVESQSDTWDDAVDHAIAVTYDGSSAAAGVRLYADGVAQASTVNANSLSSSIRHNDNRLWLSRNANTGNRFAGRYYLVAIWRRVLSAREVGQLSRNPAVAYAPRRRAIPLAAADAGASSPWFFQRQIIRRRKH